MKTIPFHSPEEMAVLADAWCRDRIQALDARSLFLPAGNTPRPLYALWERTQPEHLRRVRLIQLDDIWDKGQGPLPPEKGGGLDDGARAVSGRFRRFFEAELPFYAARIQAPGAKTRQGADLAILGLGPNGHVAFHEPGLEPTFRHGEVALSKATCRSLGVEHPHWGLSYGLAAFLESQAVVLMVSGAGKEEAYRALLSGDTRFPVAHLRHHPDLTVLVDAAYAALARGVETGQ
ncbi:MAG: 6-phosphogluconolactonase [Bdellovibrionales bacterium]|nr:6-phosphogluconolactonase [Bdellovibrionales bacterium]